jgi:endogenous inhibitor of DNA gyrase (YacG/DUF329 family)
MQNKEIKCPQCGRFTFYSPENPSRPFCSARCKLIDLGQWANESYKVPTNAHVDYSGELNPDEFNDGEAKVDNNNDPNTGED